MGPERCRFPHVEALGRIERQTYRTKLVARGGYRYLFGYRGFLRRFPFEAT
jgi:hypothetical protein